MLRDLLMTRDSAAWWIGILVALVAYLEAAPPPTQWDYDAWIRFAAAVLSTISAKMATSPLASKKEK